MLCFCSPGSVIWPFQRYQQQFPQEAERRYIYLFCWMVRSRFTRHVWSLHWQVVQCTLVCKSRIVQFYDLQYEAKTMLISAHIKESVSSPAKSPAAHQAMNGRRNTTCWRKPTRCRTRSTTALTGRGARYIRRKLWKAAFSYLEEIHEEKLKSNIYGHFFYRQNYQ